MKSTSNRKENYRKSQLSQLSAIVSIVWNSNWLSCLQQSW